MADLGPFLEPGASAASSQRVWVAPIRRAAGEAVAGFVVAGINAKLTFDAQQRLVALQFGLGLLGEQLEDDARGAREQLDHLRQALDEALGELRELAHGVYPALLVSDGLAAAVAAAGRRAPMAVAVSAEQLEPLPRDVMAAAYFCCLEALQNVAKHAGATARATVELTLDGRLLRFRVEDDGVGFHPSEVVGSHGLINLRDRLAALGGTAEIVSVPGRGTSVSGCLPLD